MGLIKVWPETNNQSTTFDKKYLLQEVNPIFTNGFSNHTNTPKSGALTYNLLRKGTAESHIYFHICFYIVDILYATFMVFM